MTRWYCALMYAKCHIPHVHIASHGHLGLYPPCLNLDRNDQGAWPDRGPASFIIPNISHIMGALTLNPQVWPGISLQFLASPTFEPQQSNKIKAIIHKRQKVVSLRRVLMISNQLESTTWPGDVAYQCRPNAIFSHVHMAYHGHPGLHKPYLNIDRNLKVLDQIVTTSGRASFITPESKHITTMGARIL